MRLPDGVVDALYRHACERPEQVACRFLGTGDVDGPVVEWTYRRLYREVLGVAAALRRELPVGSRCLLLYPPGLDFIAGFLGCLWAGMVAVPAYLPEGRQQQPRALKRMLRVMRDSGAAAVLSAPDEVGLAGRASEFDPAFAGLRWLSGDGRLPERDIAPVGGGEDVAFLQYTSGSTGSPKGVVVSHANLIHNLRSQHAAWRQPAARVVSWLPAYHDMGLVGSLLYPLFVGGTATVFAPAAFIERPVRWLAALSRFAGTMSLAPNFGYELCVRKVSEVDLAGVDLSAWAVAGNGAEPVRATTLRAFVDRFAPSGFDPRALMPCYGLAEATLFVTSARPGNWAATGIASCGIPTLDTRVLVVDPDTATPCGDGEVGEVWVGSPSNAVGYWDRPEETVDTFQARLADGAGPFLRTGDLGAFDAAGLHIRGRLKDLIIVDGVNHYPQDIEQTVEASDPAVRPGCVAAFAIDVDGRERVVVVAETAGDEMDQIVAAIRAAVLREHQVSLHAVTLVRPRTIPKTSSGKIQRRETAVRFAADTLHRHDAGAAVAERSTDEVRGWLVAHLAAVLCLPRDRIGGTEPFDSFGLTSRDVVALSVELSAWLGRPVAPSDVYGHPAVDALARHLTMEPDDTASDWDEPAPAIQHDVAAPADAVAIVGIGCRFPGADGPAGYWSLLSGGVEAVREVPADRWDIEEYFQPGGAAPGKMYTRRGGFLGDVAGFDAEFFGLSRAEAGYLDPQQRLLLEMAWAAMEDAGVPPADLAGSATGVYIGLTTGDYGQMMAAAEVNAGPYAATGNVACMAANRLSYTFDLRGPSLTVDTACSSSLVAVHQACAAIRAGDIDAALAGGVNLMLSPTTTVALCQSGALSPDGRCYTFDARANGYVRGEGAGLVLLKPLARALADGDRIYAIIRGSAVNQDGRSNGLTAPNPQAQARVIRQAYRNAGIEPGRMSYVEAHGTGTALGDPIEASALGLVLGGALPPGRRCAIGSVKTNVGHLEPAAGVAGLIKVALALHHRQLPPSLHHATTNPHIDLDRLGLRVSDTLMPWRSDGSPRIAGVNSFGVGGTNAHVVLQEASLPADPAADGTPGLLLLSGRTPEAVAGLARQFAEFLPGATASLASVCHTAGLRRTHHEHRLAIVASAIGAVVDKLASGTAGGVTGRARSGADGRVVFVCPGQGAQHVGMARVLYEHDAAFRASFDQCAVQMRQHLDWSPWEQLHADEPVARLDEEEVVQPLLFAIQVALAAAWRARGVRPDAVVGHSMGEVAAAHIAGVLDLAEAAELTCVRARLLAEVRGQGAMAVVGLHHTAVRAELPAYRGRLHLAAANGPALSVVSGDCDAVAAFQRSVEDRGVFARAVRASGAGHSPVVEPVAAAVARRFAGLRPKSAQIPLYSSVTGERIAGEEMTGPYWGRNLRDPVLFHPAVARLAAHGYRLFLEMSANPTLVVPIQQALDEVGGDGQAIGSLVRGRDDRETMLEAFGALHASGAAVDLRRVLQRSAAVTTLPTAPWQRRRYWFSEDGRGEPAAVDVGQAVADAFASVLRTPQVPPDASFFELGGSSLMAAQMLYGLRTALARDVPLRLLFDNPTVATLTHALGTTAADAMYTSSPVRVELSDYPVTVNQERYLLAELRGRPGIIVTQHLLLNGPIDISRLQYALGEVIATHDGLRTVFVQRGLGEWRQRLTASGTPPLPVLDLPASGDRDVVLSAYLNEVEQSFSLFDGPLYRFGLVRLAPERHLFAIVLHHLITDGWSQGIFYQDLLRAYSGEEPLVSPPLRLVDYAHWERAKYSGTHLGDRIAYWRNKLSEVQPPILRFVHEDRRAVAPASMKLIEVDIERTVEAALENAARRTDTTMQMMLLTSFLLTLRRHSDQDQIAVPINVSAREQPDLERLIGFLSQLRLVDVDFHESSTLRDCLLRVRNAVLKAGEEQDVSMSQYFHLDGIGQEDIPYRVSMNFLPSVDLPDRLGDATVTMAPGRAGTSFPATFCW
ncbi:beta-ketoacyl synthase N-terminal-like domain-containing protein [Phytohabitans flavus]|uniref:beta-ketoacyl synthase N-terminal-like domain-containing protein n=1 Tax=Phytohabitans flavus TaxID=1076124 RepID=UPI003640E3AA